MKNQVTYKGRVPVIVISLAVILCSGIGFLIDVFFSVLNIIGGSSGFVTAIISLIGVLVNASLNVTPVVILLMYSIVFYKKYRPRFFISAVFGLLSFCMLIQFIEKSSYVFGAPYYGIFYAILSYTQYIGLFFTLIVFLIASIISLINDKIKIVAIMALSIGIIFQLYLVFYNTADIFMLTDYLQLVGVWGVIRIFSGTYVSNFIEIFSSCILYLALFIFASTYKYNPVKLLKDMENKAPEDALEILNKNLESGTITEEEYQSQREIIMNKL
ncbi:MAG: hypothetical protein IKU82_03700 [Clostridia bacterium]|nr:hypothetical protein [Clostridia bacterium]